MTQTGERMEFKTELKQLLDIIVHSLYSEREIFLRELISNACDAIDKVRFEALTHEALREGDEDYKITIRPDKDAKTLTISDNGIGMNRDKIVSDLGTIARSGTKAFMEQLKEAKAENKPELIGQFGVGFYSSFMAADKVVVVSRAAGEAADTAVQWESDGQGEFSVTEATKETRGTDIIMHLREDCEEYLDTFRLKSVVKKYSDFVEHPVVLIYDEETTEGEGDDAVTKTETKEEQANSGKALWLRPSNEIKEEEYNEFYKSVGQDFRDPAKVLHFSIEGLLSYKALLFVPAEKPFNLEFGEAKSSLHLHIRRVFITDNCESLLPGYLRFIKGVVETDDLPLNVSRELLQNSQTLNKISKSLTGRVLRGLDEMKRKDADTYKKFFETLGVFLKEGIHTDYENREKIGNLLLFASVNTAAEESIDLNTYIESMPADQEAIYYLIGESREQIEKSPYLEVFKEKGQDVLLLTDPIDEFVVEGLAEYKGKKLVGVDRGELPEDEEQKKAKEEAGETYKDLIGKLKDLLKDEVKDVRLSARLKSSASCLVADEGEMTAHMERLMKRMGNAGNAPKTKRVLEINPEHDTVKSLQGLFETTPDDERIGLFGHLLFDQAVLAEGNKPEDPAALAERMNALMKKAL